MFFLAFLVLASYNVLFAMVPNEIVPVEFAVIVLLITRIVLLVLIVSSLLRKKQDVTRSRQ